MDLLGQDADDDADHVFDPDIASNGSPDGMSGVKTILNSVIAHFPFGNTGL